MDKDFSRPIPRTYTGVQWAVILRALQQYADLTHDGRTCVTHARQMLPDLREHVEACAQLEPIGCGLDNPENAPLLP